MSFAVDPVEATRMPLVEHLRELRRRILVSAAALLIGTVASTFLFDPLYGFLTAPMRLILTDAQPNPVIDAWYLWMTSPVRSVLPASLTEVKVQGTLATNGTMEGVYTWMYTVFGMGAFLGGPVVVFQIWRFVAPGLYPKERRMVVPLTAASTFLFVLGAGFAYLVMLPVFFPFSLQVLPTEAILSVSDYLGTTIRLLLAFGLCFQLPVAVWFMARIGLVDHKDLLAGFRYAVVAIFVVAAVLTPPDVFTQILLGVPMTLLYVFSIGVAWFSTTKVRS
jgi:sec-independent protein translocase protein TatC